MTDKRLTSGITSGAIWTDETVQEAMHRVRDAISEVERAGAAEEPDLDDIEFTEEEFVCAMGSFEIAMKEFHARRQRSAER